MNGAKRFLFFLATQLQSVTGEELHLEKIKVPNDEDLNAHIVYVKQLKDIVEGNLKKYKMKSS